MQIHAIANHVHYNVTHSRDQYNGRPSAIFRACARDDQLHVAPACQNGRSKRTSTSTSSFDFSQSEKKDRCQITIRTFEKW